RVDSACSLLYVPAPLRSPLFSRGPASSSDGDTLSLHDALPISRRRALARLAQAVVDGRDHGARHRGVRLRESRGGERRDRVRRPDRKSTRLNSSHVAISYAVFCLKKKKRQYIDAIQHEGSAQRA